MRERLERVLAALHAVEFGGDTALPPDHFHCGVCGCYGSGPVQHTDVPSGAHERWEETSAWKPCPIPGAIADVEPLLRQWTPIAERMPEPYDPVWLAVAGREGVTRGYADGERWRHDGGSERYRDGAWTHWMPREPDPTPPEAVR